MRKSGFAAAAALGSLALLLTACGGSSGSSSSSTTTSTAQPGGQATSAALSNVPPPGSTVLHVQKSSIGWVLAMGNGQVVYAYDKDPKGGTPACSNFEYGARLTEFVLLGALALRTQKVLRWDAEAGKVTNNVPEAQAIIDGSYRKGWELAV